MAAASPVSTPAAGAAAADKKAVIKPERPDEDAYHAAEAVAKKAVEEVQAKLDEVRAKIDLAKSGNSRNPRQQELKVELADIRSQVADKKGSRSKTEEQISTLQDSINARVKELNAKKNRLPYRTLADLEAAVFKLDKDVESGMMKIVDEKKAIQEINNLSRQKKTFGEMDTAQKSIDADRARLKELKDQKQDPVLKELNERYDALDKEFKAIKAEQNSAYENLSALQSERDRLQAIRQEKSQALKQIHGDFIRSRNAYRNYEREARKIRDERRAKEQAEYHLQKKRAVAAAKLEKASIPAYAEEIIACENLIIFFDPSSAEAARKAKNVAAPRELAAKAVHDVKPFEGKQGKELVKVQEDYFVGTGGKKKKGKKTRAPADETSEAAAPAAPTKINLNVGLLEELAKVDVPTPASADELPHVLAKLREKLQYYKENQDKVTQANIAKAQKEIDKLEGADESAEAEASPVAASPAVEEEKAEEEVKEEKEVKGENEEKEDKEEAPPTSTEAVSEEEPKEETAAES